MHFLKLNLCLAALIALQGCSQGDDDHSEGQGTVSTQVLTLYPGASMTIDTKPEPHLFGETDLGEITISDDGETYVYVAPMEASEDVFRITNTRTGQIAEQSKVVIAIPPASELEVLELTPGERVAAHYGAVHIEAVLLDGLTTARFRHSESDKTITIALRVADEAQDAGLRWNDTELDGYGPLTQSQAEALRALSAGPLSRAISMVALDLGCIEQAHDIPAEIYAALLFPWQMVLKYEVARRDPVVRHFMIQSRCSFPGHLGENQTKPVNIAVMWDVDHSVPMLPTIFPFDGSGQRPSLLQ